MRLWTVHPKYLDAQGLVALWREGLLALKVLRGLTRGYRNHPQLNRFRKSSRPVNAIKAYLWHVLQEAEVRGYVFDRSRIGGRATLPGKIPETTGQLDYEWQHLLNKLQRRQPQQYHRLKSIKRPQCHPLFRMTGGKVRDWEKTTQ